MKKSSLPGTFKASTKDGRIYYRATITKNSKHISLGSYDTEHNAHLAYMCANELLSESCTYSVDDYNTDSPLLFEKWVCLINFRDNGIYIKNPVYLKNGYFIYYINKEEYYLFDIDDLFYYSEHKIMKRGNHLFVADYGMQINILSRYGIKNYARPGIDYEFVNQNSYDFRKENIRLINCYIGVNIEIKQHHTKYVAKLHIRSNYIIGRYDSDIEAAIAYNKAVDIVKSNGCTKNFQTNYIEPLPASQYADIYQKLKISDTIYKLTF